MRIQEENLLESIFNGTVSSSELSIEHYIVRHIRGEQKYKSWQVDLDGKLIDGSDDLNGWLKRNICDEIKNLKKDEKLETTPYDIEVIKQGKVGVINLEEETYASLKETKEKLISSIDGESDEDDITKTNFQISKIYKEERCIYICYYGAVKKSTKKKKWIIIESKAFHEAREGVVNIGGSIDFIIQDNHIYVINNRNFEYAFKYMDLISEKRDFALNKIIALDIFDDDSIELFITKSQEYPYARGLAGISDETIANIKKYYPERCTEIKMISDKLSEATEKERRAVEEEYGILTQLTEFIDFENDNRIVIDEESNIKPLMHFFQDKIMKSFLTEKIKTILGIDKE